MANVTITSNLTYPLDCGLQDPACIATPGEKTRPIGRWVRLTPGANTVDEVDWGLMQTNPAVAALITSGGLVQT